jgi:ubiquinone/menaquinone biosynthesis C-methylase UbiE
MAAELAKALADYRILAARYDHYTRRINGVRRKAIEALALAPGETVLDIGCGTGFCFAPVMERIGSTGRLLAFDPSPDLLALARQRIERAGWRNVTLVQATAEQVDLHGARPSALLFSYVHDIMQSETALENLLAQAAAGARVAITSTRLWPRNWWPLAPLVNFYLWHTHEQFITSREENFDRPWRKLERSLHDVRVQICWPGWRYVATGRLAGGASGTAT